MFKINIENRPVLALFDTGATRSVMSMETFKILNLNDKKLDTKNIPVVVGANGTNLGAVGQITCELQIGERKGEQTFLICQDLNRNLILGVDFARKYAAGVHWTKQNSFVLTINGTPVAETKEKHQNAAVSLKARTKLPPRSCAIVDVDINTTSKNKVQILPDEYCLAMNPNMYMYKLYANLADKEEGTVCPFILVNLSQDQHIKLLKNHVVAFVIKDDTKGEIFQIEQCETSRRHWVPQRPERSLTKIADEFTTSIINKFSERSEQPLTGITKDSEEAAPLERLITKYAKMTQLGSTPQQPVARIAKGSDDTSTQ